MDKVVSLLPICSICTVHLFTPKSTIQQLHCKHIFCPSCLSDLRTSSGYQCPFDASISSVKANPELLQTALEAVESFHHLSDPRCQPYLESVYIYLMQTVNTEKVPCRVYYARKGCANRELCPYDHTPGLSTRGVCPRGMTCGRRPMCVFDHQLDYIHRPLNLQYRTVPEWYSGLKHRLAYVQLKEDCKEYGEVKRLFAESMNSHIVKIERVENAEAYVKFAYKYESVSAIKGAPLETKLLFHGTSKTSPYLISADPSGVDSRMSKAGCWGKGSYFAKSARYSHSFRHVLGENYSSILLCEVLIGDYIELPPDGRLTRPPSKPDGSGEYHSVKGRQGSSEIWVTYEPGMSYTRYIITF